MELSSGAILLILIVALLVYGGNLPEVARSIGKTVGELKRAFAETKDAVGKEINTGLKIDLDEPPRGTQRVVPAPPTPPEPPRPPASPELAKEDISKPDYDPNRIEHPN